MPRPHLVNRVGPCVLALDLGRELGRPALNLFGLLVGHVQLVPNPQPSLAGPSKLALGGQQDLHRMTSSPLDRDQMSVTTDQGREEAGDFRRKGRLERIVHHGRPRPTHWTELPVAPVTGEIYSRERMGPPVKASRTAELAIASRQVVRQIARSHAFQSSGMFVVSRHALIIAS